MNSQESLRYKDFLVRWVDLVWTQENADAIEEMFVTDGPAHGLGTLAVIGPDDFRQFHATS